MLKGVEVKESPGLPLDGLFVVAPNAIIEFYKTPSGRVLLGRVEGISVVRINEGEGAE